VKIPRKRLNKRQIEAYNLQKVSAIFADLGFVTIRMTSDWGDADFIAQHIDGPFLKVQLKGRLSFDKKYCGKNLFICFPQSEIWYLYPHDELLKQNLKMRLIGREFWKVHGACTKPQTIEITEDSARTKSIETWTPTFCVRLRWGNAPNRYRFAL
jgi:hypothetical protein